MIILYKLTMMNGGYEMREILVLLSAIKLERVK